MISDRMCLYDNDYDDFSYITHGSERQYTEQAIVKAKRALDTVFDNAHIALLADDFYPDRIRWLNIDRGCFGYFYPDTSKLTLIAWEGAEIAF